jgi:hypothetical protein
MPRILAHSSRRSLTRRVGMICTPFVVHDSALLFARKELSLATNNARRKPRLSSPWEAIRPNFLGMDVDGTLFWTRVSSGSIYQHEISQFLSEGCLKNGVLVTQTPGRTHRRDPRAAHMGLGPHPSSARARHRARWRTLAGRPELDRLQARLLPVPCACCRGCSVDASLKNSNKRSSPGGCGSSASTRHSPTPMDRSDTDARSRSWGTGLLWRCANRLASREGLHDDHCCAAVPADEGGLQRRGVALDICKLGAWTRDLDRTPGEH